MDEMLFKGKRKDNDEWVEGPGINTQQDFRGRKHFFIGVSKQYDSTPLSYYIEWYEVYPESVGQYINVLDENGKKIFTGDIVEFTSHGYYPSTNRGVVVLKKGSYGIEHLLSFAYRDETEKIFHRIGHIDKWQDMGASGEVTYTYKVIGNNSDNPELIGGGANA